MQGKCSKWVKYRQRKTKGQKINRAPQIHSTLSGHEIPKYLKNGKKQSRKMFKMGKVKLKKNDGPKKIRALGIHSILSENKMP